MTHEPECPIQGERTAALFPCICPEVRAAYRRGYNDHARTVQHWQDTHGAYRAYTFAQNNPIYQQHGEGTNP